MLFISKYLQLSTNFIRVFLVCFVVSNMWEKCVFSLYVACYVVITLMSSFYPFKPCCVDLTVLFFLWYLGGKQKHKVVPTDQNHGCQQRLRLTPYKDLTPLVTLHVPSCLTVLWAAACQHTSWQSIPVPPPRTPIVMIMRMCHVWTGRAALWPMTSMRLAKLRAGAAAVRLVGWKTRSMDNAVDAGQTHLTQLDWRTQYSPSLPTIHPDWLHL